MSDVHVMYAIVSMLCCYYVVNCHVMSYHIISISALTYQSARHALITSHFKHEMEQHKQIWELVAAIKKQMDTWGKLLRVLF